MWVETRALKAGSECLTLKVNWRKGKRRRRRDGNFCQPLSLPFLCSRVIDLEDATHFQAAILPLRNFDAEELRELATLCQELTYGSPLDRRVALADEALAIARSTGNDAVIVQVLNLLTIPLRVPPLRDYAEDVPDLLRYYVDRLVDDQHLPLRRFSVAAQNRLRNYPWPGNVGELKNLVQRVLILGAGEEIRLEEIERELAVKLGVDEPLVKQDLLALPLREAREQFERAYLQQQLLLCNGKVGQLAKRVGMERTHLYRKLRALGVDFRQLGED